MSVAAGKFTVVKLEQFSKAQYSILVTAGKSTVVKL